MPCFSFSKNKPAALLLAVLVAVLPALAAARPARAQQSPPAGAEGSQAARFRLANRYLKGGDAERAIALLEDLYDEHPSTRAFYLKLKDAYESRKRYADAIALVEREMKQRGRSPALLSQKARLQYQGDAGEKAAFATWDTALAAAPQKSQTYRTVYGSLVDARLFQHAIEAVLKGRRALGDPSLMRLQLAYLYSLTSRHEKAAREYLALLRVHPDRLSFVERRLGRFLEKEQPLKESIAATSRAVHAEPQVRPYRRLMGWLYLKDGEHEKAFKNYRALDRLDGADGHLLYAFARQAADAGAYRAALDAYALVLKRHPDARAAPGALRGMGRVHEQWAANAGPSGDGKNAHQKSGEGRQDQYEKALDAYRRFLKKYPDDEHYPSVLRAVGRLQQDALFDLEGAQKTLEEVARRYPQTQAAHLAGYDLGRLYVMRGDLAKADRAFARLAGRLAGRLPASPLAQQARYQRALLHFYRGDFDAAGALLDTLARTTDADVANDGLRLGALLTENAASRDTTGAALRLFATARLRHRQHRDGDALKLLDTLLARHPRSPVADDAHFFKARTLAAQHRPADAADAYARLALTYPQSTLADRSLYQAARLRETALRDPHAALATYQRLLTDYPGSLYLPDARTRIQSLRHEVKATQAPAS